MSAVVSALLAGTVLVPVGALLAALLNIDWGQRGGL